MLVAGLLMLGICAHAALPTWPVVWAAFIALLLFGAAFFRRCPLVSCGLIAAAVAVSGVGLAQLSASYYPRDHISAFAGEQARLANLELALDDPPRVLADPFTQGRPVPPKQVARGRVLRVKTWGGWAECDGDVLLQIAQPHPRLAAGQTVRVLGMLQRPAPAMNPGQFDWAQHYRGQRLLASVSVPHADNVQILTDGRAGLLCGAREKVRHLLAAGFPAARALDHALLRAMLLGDHDPELRDVQEQFQRTGASYHLSVTGMHVAVLAGAVYWLCRLLCLGPRRTVCLTTVFVVAYGLMALPSVPVVRAVLLCMAAGFALLSGRAADKLQLLALCATAMLIAHPTDLYSAGFQLGFGTVLGLVLLTPPALDFLRSLRDPDRVVAEQWIIATGKSGAAGAAWRWVRRRLALTAVVSLVAWVVSMPLVAYHFEQINTWALLADLLLAPAVLLALVAGAAKVLLTFLWPGLAGLWAWAAALPVQWIRGVLGLLAKLPGADLALPAPPVWLILLFYALLCLPLLLRRCGGTGPRLKWCGRGGPVAACAMLLMLPLLGGFTRHEDAPPAEEGLRVTLLAVGAGQCAVVEPPGGGAALFDAGSDSMSDVLRSCLGPFLRHEGRRQIESVFLSHGDYDHISAADGVVAAYDVSAVYASPHLRRHAHESQPCEDLLYDLDHIDRSPRLIVRDGRVKLADGAEVEVLWPPANSNFDSNNTGLVLRLTYAGKSVLFPADIQEPAERELLKDPARLKSDVLVAPHHGSSESTTAAFVRAVAPSIILSSNDRKLTVKQLNFEKMIDHRPLYRTHRCGAITLTITREGQVRVTTFVKPKP